MLGQDLTGDLKEKKDRGVYVTKRACVRVSVPDRMWRVHVFDFY